jgi:short-subunit dehydrogenase
MENSNKTALITGASNGIGLEITKLFAAEGYNLIIVARDEAKLNELVGSLKQAGAGKVTVIAKDLSLPQSAPEIHALTTEKGIRVNVLVNNAGMGEHGFFHETSLEKEMSIIQLNITSLVQMTKLYLQDMLKHNEGKILQLASVASYQPTPLLAVYAASKAFVLSFTDAVINELKDTEVTMTALIPGATDTDFFHKAGAENTKAAQDNPADPAVVAQIGFDALLKGEHHATAPGVKQQIIMSSLLPNEDIASSARKQMENVSGEDAEK